MLRMRAGAKWRLTKCRKTMCLRNIWIKISDRFPYPPVALASVLFHCQRRVEKPLFNWNVTSSQVIRKRLGKYIKPVVVVGGHLACRRQQSNRLHHDRILCRVNLGRDPDVMTGATLEGLGICYAPNLHVLVVDEELFIKARACDGDRFGVCDGGASPVFLIEASRRTLADQGQRTIRSS